MTPITQQAFFIADESTRSDIESNCRALKIGTLTWYDTVNLIMDGPEFVQGIERAVAYLGQRTEDQLDDAHLATQHCMVRHPQRPELVRFVRPAASHVASHVIHYGTIYLSGPMSGLPQLNHPAFQSAAQALRALRLTVVNPAELNINPHAEWAACLRQDIKALCECHTIAHLDGWEKSKGAVLETHIAVSLGMIVKPVADILRGSPVRTERPVGYYSLLDHFSEAA